MYTTSFIFFLSLMPQILSSYIVWLMLDMSIFMHLYFKSYRKENVEWQIILRITLVFTFVPVFTFTRNFISCMFWSFFFASFYFSQTDSFFFFLYFLKKKPNSNKLLHFFKKYWDILSSPSTLKGSFAGYIILYFSAIFFPQITSLPSCSYGFSWGISW